MQADLGMDVILKLFSIEGLTEMFNIDIDHSQASENANRIFSLRNEYISTIGPIIAFLQDQDPSLAYQICSGNYLPNASRFDQLADMEFAFGIMGIRDKARHLATLYLEDISDYIIELIDPFFGFSRYAERLGRSAHSFDELHEQLTQAPSFIDHMLFSLLEKYFQKSIPDLLAISVPFPGNLYCAFRCGQWVKLHYPQTKICMGGGFANTELRSLKDVRVFEFFDFITLDDGEAPILHLIEHVEGKRPIDFLKRTFTLLEDKVQYFNGSMAPDYKQKDVGTPDYEGLNLKQYLSVIEVTNPMHRLWSDGRWNKLTLAHGCYWGKCTFCDINLDYIGNYEFTTAQMLVDRMEELILQTGERGFHFVDEAAPPALMKEIAIEILRRKLTITWWTNIRFEKSFTADLCRLLSLSGCIAISGGLEVASDRLLKLIKKGVTVGQVAKVAQNFTQSGIMVHSYLMYGFPTQNEQETIDSLEVVRQLFEAGVVQSGFWHQFALTAHSPVGKNPAEYNVRLITEEVGTFANNDLEFEDLTGCDHESFSDGLKKSLFNYMNGICFEYELQEWFDFEIPETTIDPDHIQNILEADESRNLSGNKRVLFTGILPFSESLENKNMLLLFHTKSETFEIELEHQQGLWLSEVISKAANYNETLSILHLRESYDFAGLRDFDEFWIGEEMEAIKSIGLLVV